MEPITNKLAFSVLEVAHSLGVSRGFIRLEICRKKLKPTRLGRRILIMNSELRRYLAENTERAEAADAR